MMFESSEVPIDYTSLGEWEIPILDNDLIWSILNEEITDLQVDRILWHYLGYRYIAPDNSWDVSQVDPDWITTYPTPPDFIASRPAAVKLTRSIPAANKQLLKEKLGFKGYKIGEFGPRQTRRATAASWLLSQMQME
jgi:Domain of unknown function (DUF1823)